MHDEVEVQPETLDPGCKCINCGMEVITPCSWLIKKAVCGPRHIKACSIDLDSHADTGYSHLLPFKSI